MKKLIALLTVMALLLAVPFAYAEGEEAQMPFEGEWVEFETYQIYLPTGLKEVEITDEMADQGIYYVLADDDDTHAIHFAYTQLEQEISVEDLVAQFQETYGEDNVATIEKEDHTIVYYVDQENDGVCFMVLDPVDPGLYMFVFVPASDGDFMVTAGAVMATLAFTEAEN